MSSHSNDARHEALCLSQRPDSRQTGREQRHVRLNRRARPARTANVSAVGHDCGYISRVRITYDPEADAAYISLTAAELMPGRDSIPCGKPEDVDYAWVVMDWQEGRIVGLEVLDASKLLHPDLLAQAQPPGSR